MMIDFVILPGNAVESILLVESVGLAILEAIVVLVDSLLATRLSSMVNPTPTVMTAIDQGSLEERLRPMTLPLMVVEAMLAFSFSLLLVTKSIAISTQVPGHFLSPVCPLSSRLTLVLRLGRSRWRCRRSRRGCRLRIGAHFRRFGRRC